MRKNACNNKYLVAFYTAIKQQLSEKGQLLGSIGLYAVLIYLFFQVFESVAAIGPRLWYIGITRWIIASTPSIAFQMAYDIKSHSFGYFLIRPIHYLGLRFSEGLGVSLVRCMAIGPVCIFLCFKLTGHFPISSTRIFLGMLLIMGAILLYILMTLLIGMTAFWLKDIKNIFYLNLTASFCFGGLTVPLDFYPTTIRCFCWCTPYPFILWAPAQWITGGEVSLCIIFMALLGWILFFCLLLAIMYKKCIHSFLSESI